MACYHPITAYRSRLGRDRKTGSWPVVFNKRYGYVDMEVQLPCGQCIGCRLEHSRQWAMRCMFEAQMHKANCFITLTYSDDCLPEDHSLHGEHWTLFMKRFRRRVKRQGIKFYMCGEYGSEHDRPHYHACVFGYSFADKHLVSRTAKPGASEVRLYRSDLLESLWPYGFSRVGEVTFESAAYVARYCLKKVTGENAPFFYAGRVPEFSRVSLRPALGKTWFERFGATDVLPYDQVILRGGLRMTPPRYYDNMVAKVDRALLERIKFKRGRLVDKDDNTYDRLAVKEVIHKQRSTLLTRSMHYV
nr:MAG: replication initiator protein [Microviridae sp.]